MVWGQRGVTTCLFLRGRNLSLASLSIANPPFLINSPLSSSCQWKIQGSTSTKLVWWSDKTLLFTRLIHPTHFDCGHTSFGTMEQQTARTLCVFITFADKLQSWTYQTNCQSRFIFMLPWCWKVCNIPEIWPFVRQLSLVNSYVPTNAMLSDHGSAQCCMKLPAMFSPIGQIDPQQSCRSTTAQLNVQHL